MSVTNWNEWAIEQQFPAGTMVRINEPVQGIDIESNWYTLWRQQEMGESKYRIVTSIYGDDAAWVDGYLMPISALDAVGHIIEHVPPKDSYVEEKGSGRRGQVVWYEHDHEGDWRWYGSEKDRAKFLIEVRWSDGEREDVHIDNLDVVKDPPKEYIKIEMSGGEFHFDPNTNGAWFQYWDSGYSGGTEIVDIDPNDARAIIKALTAMLDNPGGGDTDNLENPRSME